MTTAYSAHGQNMLMREAPIASAVQTVFAEHLLSTRGLVVQMAAVPEELQRVLRRADATTRMVIAGAVPMGRGSRSGSIPAGRNRTNDRVRYIPKAQVNITLTWAFVVRTRRDSN
ncbi:hypothetical protein, partial [Actinocorallia lasiicapitis]